MAVTTFQDLYNSRPATRDQFTQQLISSINANDITMRDPGGTPIPPTGWGDPNYVGPIPEDWDKSQPVYGSDFLDTFFGKDSGYIVSPRLFGQQGYTFSGPTMYDPYQSNRHVGRWTGDIGTDGKPMNLRWENDSTHTSFMDRIGEAMPYILGAVALGGAAGYGPLAGGGAPGAGLSAGAIEGAVGLPELGLATQTGLGGSMTLPTAGLGGLMEGVAPALPSGTGLGLTGGSGITGGTLTSSPLLTGGGLAPGLEALASAGGSSLGWLGDLAKTALGKDGWLPSVLNAFSQNQQGNIQRDWAERLYQDRAQFLQRLARTYTNPEEFLSGPEYQALSKTTLDKLQRQDAAKGRLATDVQRQKLMQDYAFEYLNKYRTGLASAAGLTQTTGIPELDKSGAANIWGTLNAPLAQIARGVTNDSFDVGSVVDRVFNLGSWFE